MTADRHIAVVGAGITGLAAALAAVDAGAQVTVFESDDRLGGLIRTAPFAGHAAIDEGADAVLARVPWGVDLAGRVGLENALTSPATGKAAVWWNGLHDIPEGLLLGVPTGIRGLARSPLLTTRGKVRAATEVLRRRIGPEVDTIGHYVRARFGDEVHERLVDPLIGSIYAADTDDFSLAAVPQLAELAGRSRSVLLSARIRPPAAQGPVFYAPRQGVGALVDAAGAAIMAGGAAINYRSPVVELAADGQRWRVNGELFDGVILASPARHAAALLTVVSPAASTTLRAIPTADVVVLTLAVPLVDWPDRLSMLSGYLVPKPQQRLVTAASFASQKWAHWADGQQVILRVSLGRDGLPVLHLGDDELIAVALDDLRRHSGVDLQPSAIRITRTPHAFPQYRPHHGTTIAAAERSLPAGLALAGASYHGIGIPACIRSGQAAATAVLGSPTTQ
jgi:protoporphyrinogen/coproporphyrinogen III oxidase